jgi:hypothetical protein
MNLYVVVEGLTEKTVYSEWIPQLNPLLHEVDHVADVTNNTFVIVQGGGMPQYYDLIASAIEDINSLHTFDRFVICVDSEDMTYADKLAEIVAFIKPLNCSVSVHIVVQHFCFEAWALGNHRAMPLSIHDPKLVQLKKHFDVSKRDPELLTPVPDSDLNRAQTAHGYLRAMLRAKWPHGSRYTKGRNAGPVAHTTYLRNLRLRIQNTKHIASFDHLVKAFS